jgi:NADP-dependent 3-hydroxy acid dehydrogenase YdfG
VKGTQPYVERLAYRWQLSRIRPQSCRSGACRRASAGRHGAQTEQLADLVTKYGNQVRAVAPDVTDSAAAHNAVQSAIDAFGCLDMMVNNAGYGNIASIEDVAEEDFRAMGTNFYWRT